MKHQLAGSNRDPLPGARAIGKADPNERLEVTLVLRRRASDAFAEHLSGLTTADGSTDHLSLAEYETRFGADPADIQAVVTFAASAGLAIVQQDPGRRTMVLSGTVAQFNTAFGVDLEQYEHPGGSYRGRVGAVHLPDALGGIVEAVLGLDNRPQATPHLRAAAQAPSAATSYTPVAVGALYGFPDGDAAGQCIALIELGGGYKTADLKSYFGALGVTAPRVSSVSVDHGRNHTSGSANSADGEVMLDIEVAGALAPAAKIAVYFAPNTDAGFLDAITTAIHDAKNQPSVISISWGGPESGWTQQAMTAFDQAFQTAVTLGITVCVASGDNGSSDNAPSGGDHVDFPASSPHVLACGGTALHGSGSVIASETVWNDGSNGGATGGGVSTAFDLPSWQQDLTATRTGGAAQALAMRGVPDVAGNADPETGYQVRVDGQNTVVGGTSAVAPLWAGLIARLNAKRQNRIGFLNPALYASRSALRDVTSGNNGDFTATVGWDACTGLGTPNGPALAALFAAANASLATGATAVAGGSDPCQDRAFLTHGNGLPGDGSGDSTPGGAAHCTANAFLTHGNSKPVDGTGPGDAASTTGGSN